MTRRTSCVRVIVATAEGNPFYVEELIKNLIDERIIQIDRAADVWRIDRSRLMNLHVPPTLTALLQARLDSLTPAERNTLQQAAVVGRIFWDALLQALQRVPQPPRRELAELTQRELIYARPTPAFAHTHEYMFQHALLRDVVYDTVLKRTRQIYHARSAAWLIEATRARGRAEEYAAVIAEHYALAGETGLAAEWYCQAGERAKAQGAFLEARKFFDRTLDLLPPTADREQRWRALLERSEVLGVLGDSDARLADDQALLALAHDFGDDNHLAEAHYRAGTWPGMLGDHLRGAALVRGRPPPCAARGQSDSGSAGAGREGGLPDAPERDVGRRRHGRRSPGAGAAADRRIEARARAE